MLKFEIHPEFFRVIEYIHLSMSTKVKTVDYSKDLPPTKVRVNNEPWRETTKESKKWFMDYHYPKFKQIENKEINTKEYRNEQ